MRIFLDSSVLLAAAGSDVGASREVFRRKDGNGWVLVTTPYVLNEVIANLGWLPEGAAAVWDSLRKELVTLEDVFTIDRPALFARSKDRPILFSALAWADVLLTLDRNDFRDLLDSTFYGLDVLTPGKFLERRRSAGHLA